MSTDPRTLELERGLRDLGTTIEYPPTPDLKPAVFAALERDSSTTPRTRRLQLVGVLILGLILLIAAAVVAADPLGWFRQAGVSRGPQFTGDYTLLGLWRLDTDGHETSAQRRFVDLDVDPAGTDLYVFQAALEDPSLAPPRELRRIPVGDPGSSALLGLEPLAGESIWGMPPPSDSTTGPIDGVVPLEDGRLIALVGRWSRPDRERVYAAPAPDQASTAIVQRDADGEWTPIIRLDELVRIDASTPASLTAEGVTTQLAASADRIWLLVVQPGPWIDGVGHQVQRRLWEVRDPNSDGRWDDRVATALALPPDLREERLTECCLERLDLVVVDGEERLVLTRPTATSGGGFRLTGHVLVPDDDRVIATAFLDVRIPDLFGAMEAGGFHVEAVGLADGSIQLVVTDWSRVGRISLLHPEHDLVDIGRGFSRISDIATTRDGRIFVLQDDDSIHMLVPRSQLGPQG